MKCKQHLRQNAKSRKREILKRLNYQFPSQFVDDEPQSELKQPKLDIAKVLNHVHQLLVNGECLQDYFMNSGSIMTE